MKKVDVAQHSLIPKHVKLSDTEKATLLERLKITSDNLPKILKTDAALTSITAKAGDVIKVVRKSPTAGESVFYRVIIHG